MVGKERTSSSTSPSPSSVNMSMSMSISMSGVVSDPVSPSQKPTSEGSGGGGTPFNFDFRPSIAGLSESRLGVSCKPLLILLLLLGNPSLEGVVWGVGFCDGGFGGVLNAATLGFFLMNFWGVKAVGCWSCF